MAKFNNRKTLLCDKVCQWLTAGRRFSPGTPVSSTNKTDSHDKTEILLKVALNTITLTLIIERPLWGFQIRIPVNIIGFWFNLWMKLLLSTVVLIFYFLIMVNLMNGFFFLSKPPPNKDVIYKQIEM